MNETRARRPRRIGKLERGFTLVEVSIAMVIALFLLGGMLTLLQSARNTSTDQSRLAQLQDEERVAMTMMTDVIQQAGYYPNAQASDPTAVFAVTPAFSTAGQVVAGGSNAYGDTVTVRYQGDSTNSVLDCLGGTIAANVIEEMQFSVQPGTNGQLQLVCSVNGAAPVPLVSNVQGLTVLYGVDANASGSVNTYLPTASMAPYWTSIYSVKIIVTFGNPFNGQAGQSATIPFSRVVGIMSRSGVNVLNFT